MSEPIDLALVGASGAAGEAVLALLEERGFPIATLHALEVDEMAGERITFKGEQLLVGRLSDFDFGTVPLAIFCVDPEVCAEYAPVAAAAGCIVIDTSGRFCDEPEIPLVVPQVNPLAIGDYDRHNIIALPDCTTMQLTTVLKPLYDTAGLTRVEVVSLVPVSSRGRAGIEELAGQTALLLNAYPVEPRVFPKQIAFNVIPQVANFQPNGYTNEETNIIAGVPRVFEDDSLQINATSVQVPVFHGHSAVLHIQTREEISASEVRSLLEQAPGITVIDAPEEDGFPTPVGEAATQEGVFVGRIRQDLSSERGLNLWSVADAVRTGMALNSVQVGEILVKDYM